MDWIQVHLLLNHVPVIGTWIGTGVLVWGLVARKEETRRLALGLLAIVALAAAPAFFSGSEAEERAEALPGVSSAEVSEHESAADFALAGCMVLGVVAIAALLVSRGGRRSRQAGSPRSSAWPSSARRCSPGRRTSAARSVIPRSEAAFPSRSGPDAVSGLALTHRCGT